MNEENEVYEAEVEEPVNDEEEYDDDDTLGFGEGVALGAGAVLAGILVRKVYREHVKPGIASVKARLSERKASKSKDMLPYDEDDWAEDDDESVEAPKKK